MEYVFSGEDLANVLRENAIRIARGTLVVRPLDDGVPEADEKEVFPADDKAVNPTDKKKPAKKKK